MCVAVIVKSKSHIPSDHLEAMAEHNPDGGGIAWLDGDQVQYRKGLTWQQIDAYQDLIPRPFFMHFRIATRGGKIPELTHPFPVGAQAFSEDLVGMAPAVIIHNGTWSDFEKYVPEGIDKKSVSDTQIAAYVASWNEDILSEVKWSNAMMKAKGPNGRPVITSRGNWSEFEGNQYSNLHWKVELYRGMGNDEWNDYFNKKYGPTGRTTTPVTPIVARKKGEKSHQQGRGPDGKPETHVGKLISKRAAKRAAKKEARRVAKQAKSNISAYDKALVSFNSKRGGTVNRNPENENNALAWGSGREVKDFQSHGSWKGERLFTEDELRPPVRHPSHPTVDWGRKDPWDEDTKPYLTLRKGSAPCPYCRKEITQIPCECGGFDDDETIVLDMNDVEDMNAEGLTYEDLLEAERENMLEEYGSCNAVPDYRKFDNSGPINTDDEMEELLLSGDRPGDAQKVDDYIRLNGIKI